MKTKIMLFVLLTGVVLFVLKAYGVISAPDTQCSTHHTTSSQPPAQQVSAEDYFELGNYQYDLGNCIEALAAYGQAISLDPNFAQVYNNRAYTNMRLRHYEDALEDLDMAISLNPNYVEALMNRGDIYNYYYTIDRQKAISDYNRVIAIGKEKDKSNSVCGHKAMAETNNMVPLAIMKVLANPNCISR